MNFREQKEWEKGTTQKHKKNPAIALLVITSRLGWNRDFQTHFTKSTHFRKQ